MLQTPFVGRGGVGWRVPTANGTNKKNNPSQETPRKQMNTRENETRGKSRHETKPANKSVHLWALGGLAVVTSIYPSSPTSPRASETGRCLSVAGFLIFDQPLEPGLPRCCRFFLGGGGGFQQRMERTKKKNPPKNPRTNKSMHAKTKRARNQDTKQNQRTNPFTYGR